MSAIPQTNAGEVRTESVILGRQDYISVLLRLIGMEIYKIRRRIMSKVLFSIAIVIAILVFLLFSLNTFFALSAPPESFVPSCQPRGQPQPNCPPPSAAQVAQFREDALRSASEPLR